MAPGSTQPSNRNEYKEYFMGGKGGRCVKLTNLSPSCADCLEIWEPQTSWNPVSLSRPVMELVYFSKWEDRIKQCFSTAGTRPGTGTWHQLYRAARGSPGICHFSFLSNFHE